MVDYILNHKIIMIVRGVSADKLIDLAEAVLRGGINLLECTYDSTGKIPDEEIAKNIETLAKHFQGRMLIGAGTVLTKKQVQLTKKAGGAFIISPDTNEEIIKESKSLGLVSMPGSATPSEATAAVRAGADFVKLFPVSQLGGMGYIKALSAPLSHIRFMAVGGVKPDTLTDYLDAGACGVGIGLNEQDKLAINNGDFEHIVKKCLEYSEKIR